MLSGSVSASKFAVLILLCARTGGGGGWLAAVPIPVAMAALLMVHRLLLPLHHSCGTSASAARGRAAPSALPALPASSERA